MVPSLEATALSGARAVDAVAEARAALVEQVGDDVVGDHVGHRVEGAAVVSHLFTCTQSGYPGWHWSVTVVDAPGNAHVTIAEVVLLPGDTAILAPAWLPWRERIRPGDLSPGDILPTDEDDPRLVPGYFAGDDDTTPRAEQKSVADEVGLGRSRVLGPDGRDAAAQRWFDGDFGPGSPLAQSAAHSCATCGFMIRLAGPLNDTFAACANEFANADGRIVALAHGCGAHSEAQLRRKQLPPPPSSPHFDTLTDDDDLDTF